MCSSGIAGLDRVVVEDDQHVFPTAPGGHAGFARPADLEVAPGSERVAIVEPEGELCHQGGHLLAQIGVETDLLDVRDRSRRGRTGRCLRERPSRAKTFTGAPRNLKFTSFMVTLPSSKTNRPCTFSMGSSMVPPGSRSGLRGPCHLQAHVRLGPRHDHDMSVVGLARRDVDLGFDVATTRWIDDGPASLPGRRKRVFQLAAERKVLGFQLERRS